MNYFLEGRKKQKLGQWHAANLFYEEGIKNGCPFCEYGKAYILYTGPAGIIKNKKLAQAIFKRMFPIYEKLLPSCNKKLSKLFNITCFNAYSVNFPSILSNFRVIGLGIKSSTFKSSSLISLFLVSLLNLLYSLLLILSCNCLCVRFCFSQILV